MRGLASKVLSRFEALLQVMHMDRNTLWHTKVFKLLSPQLAREPDKLQLLIEEMQGIPRVLYHPWLNALIEKCEDNYNSQFGVADFQVRIELL